MFDAVQIDTVVGDIEPEVVVCLLTTLPKWGPKRVKDFEPATKLWGRGARTWWPRRSAPACAGWSPSR